LSPALTVRQFHGRLTLGADEVVLDDASGSLAGGQIAGMIGFKTGLDGLTTRLKVSISDADAAALLPVSARPPVSGRLNVQAKVEGSGRSPATLVGSLHGDGKISLSGGQFAGLDPRAFSAVTRAVDQGLPVEAAKIENVASRALASGQLNIKNAEGALAIGAGQIRLADSKASGEGADLTMSGAFDLTNGTLNARLVLTGTDTAAGARPDIFLALNGPLGAPSKTIDVSGLTGWLTLRAIDQQSKKLNAIEAAPDVQPEARPEAKSETKSEAKPETRSKAEPEAKPETTPAVVQPKEPPKKKPAAQSPRAASVPQQQPRTTPAPSAPALPPPINILPRIDPPPPTR
jgi:large subunit ribosomal protein L24